MVHWVVDGVLLAGLVVQSARFWMLRADTFDGEWIEDRYAAWREAGFQAGKLEGIEAVGYAHDLRIRDVIRGVDSEWDFGKSRDHICLHHDIATDEWWAHVKDEA